ncbi:flippase [Halococcus sp. PRR34]|uniref:flippase n=1 Tax=Halococcus sp. PRR34 TaxID=3020830 RepID=UPI00235E6A4D|nr:flippase [Halococcus sp. PRR34]
MGMKKATVAVFVSTIARNLLSFFAVAYFSRTLGTATLGMYFLFQSVLSMLAIPTDLGVRVGVEKRLSEGKDPGPILGSAIAVKIGLLAVMSIVILLLRGWLADYIGADVAVLLVIALLLNELGRLGDRTLRGEQRVSETAIFQPLRTAVWAGLGAILVWAGFGEWALLYSYTAGLLGIVFVALWRVDSPIGRPTIEHTRSLIGYSKFAAIGSVGGLIYNWADVLLLGFFLGQAAVGAYEVAWRVATASMVLSNAVRTSIFPQTNTWGADGDFERIESLIESAVVPSFYLEIPAFVGIIVVGDEILSTLFAVNYSMAAVVLAILMIEKLQKALVVILIAPMHAVGRVDLDAYITLLSVAANIVFNLLLIPRFGIVGAAIGTTLAAMVKTVVHVWFLSQIIQIRIPYRPLAWCAIAAILMGSIIIVVEQYVSPKSVTGLIAIVCVGGVVYNGITMVSSTIRQQTLNTLPFDVFSYFPIPSDK